MNQIILKENEFVIRVLEEGDQVRFELENPHTRVGSDGQYDIRAWTAIYAFHKLSGNKLKRVKTQLKNQADDESDTELHSE